MFDAQQWRERAEQSRINAEQTTEPAAREVLFEIAQVYEKLARNAEESAKERPPISGPPLTT
jgi:hypothetical protein